MYHWQGPTSHMIQCSGTLRTAHGMPFVWVGFLRPGSMAWC